MFRAQSNIFDDVVVKATDENLTSENWEYILVRSSPCSALGDLVDGGRTLSFHSVKSYHFQYRRPQRRAIAFEVLLLT
jgi:hypothetical protein